MTALSEKERAFAENLILLAGAAGPDVLYLIKRKAFDQRLLWEQAAEFGVADKQSLNDCYRAASAGSGNSSQAALFSPGARVGPWELVEKRCSGVGGGEVWLARLGGGTALMRLVPPGSGQDPERSARFTERSNPGLDPPDPSVLKIDEAGEDFGWLYTSTHGFDAETLETILERGPLAEASALSFALSLANTLGVVHSLGVVHGAVNPLGILVRDGQTYLSDFGLCSGLLDGPTEGNVAGGRLEALLFASPQLIRGDAARGLEGRDDLYSLGCLMYHGLVEPGPDDVPQADGPWLVEPPVSPGTREVLSRLLSPTPERRYANVAGLEGDLNRLLRGEAPASLVTSERPVRGRRAPTAIPQEALGVGEAGSELGAVSSAARPVAPRKGPPRKKTTQKRVVAPLASSDSFVEELDSTEDGYPGNAAVASGVGVRKGASGRLGQGKGPAKGKKKGTAPAKVSKLGKASSGRVAVEPARQGGGWGAFFFTLLVVGGGLGGALFLTQPEGSDKARLELARSASSLLAPQPDYGEAWRQASAALAVAEGDLELARVALALQERVVAAGLEERQRLLSAGDGSGPGQPGEGGSEGEGDAGEAEASSSSVDVGALQDLSLRCRGVRLESLVDYDVAKAKGTLNSNEWAQLAGELMRAGWAEAAAGAYQEAGRDEVGLARFAATLSYLPGGPCLLPKGDTLAVGRREPCYVGRTEVSRGEYRRFLAGLSEEARSQRLPVGWSPAPGEDDGLPATGLDVRDAEAYAKWRGCILPDPATLEVAARGRLGQRFPWGDLPYAAGRANADGLLGALAPVGSFPAGVAPCGALDLLGNAAELSRGKDPGKVELFGGTFATPAGELNVGSAETMDLEESRADVGFRLMLSFEAP